MEITMTSMATFINTICAQIREKRLLIIKKIIDNAKNGNCQYLFEVNFDNGLPFRSVSDTNLSKTISLIQKNVNDMFPGLIYEIRISHEYLVVITFDWSENMITPEISASVPKKYFDINIKKSHLTQIWYHSKAFDRASKKAEKIFLSVIKEKVDSQVKSQENHFYFTDTFFTDTTINIKKMVVAKLNQLFNEYGCYNDSTEKHFQCQAFIVSNSQNLQESDIYVSITKKVIR